MSHVHKTIDMHGSSVHTSDVLPILYTKTFDKSNISQFYFFILLRMNQTETGFRPPSTSVSSEINFAQSTGEFVSTG